MFRARVDTAGLEREVRKVQRQLPRCSSAATLALGKVFGDFIQANWPRDTNRSVAAWLRACNQVGLGPYAVPAIRPSALTAEFIERLTLQLERAQRQRNEWGAIVKRYERQFSTGEKKNKGRTAVWYGDALRRLDRAAALAERAGEELKNYQEHEGAVVIFGGKGRALKLTVRYKVYGGQGAYVQSGDQAWLLLKNLEPHAQFVEQRHRTIAMGFASLKRAGVLRAGRSVGVELARASPAVKPAAAG